ncbi:TIGR02300 family protein [Methylosinus sp. PW1]|uniref:TIGR02300 family protein n=1 Tax=Methylosinus sp. PW1 TaxID=107636 RepID=UPI000567FB49|nr:TIGR02300 family protein [Methylosinus sp. PW1]
MAKAELGAKRRCLSCGAAFFDLNREPITCPKCAAIFQVVELPRSLPRRAPYRSMAGDARIGDQPSSDAISSTETEAEEETETEEEVDEDAEADDSVPPPIDDDDKIEEIDDLL